MSARPRTYVSLTPSANEDLSELYLKLQDATRPLRLYKRACFQLLDICDKYSHRVANDLVTIHLSDVSQARRWYQDLLGYIEEWANLDALHLLIYGPSVEQTLKQFSNRVPKHMRDTVPQPDLRRRLEECLQESDSLKEVILDVLLSGQHLQMTLSVEELSQLVNLIDWVLDDTEPDTHIYTVCLQSLRDLCSRSRILPCCIGIDGSQAVEKGGNSYTTSGSADIYRGKLGYEDVAIKVMRSYDDAQNREMERIFYAEVVTWKHLRHPNIVQLVGVSSIQLYNTVDSQGAASRCMISHWTTQGSVTEYLTENPVANRLQLTLDCISGLGYLHSMGLVHGDLRGENILVNHDSRACLYDFSQTRLWSYKDSERTSIPSPSAASVWWTAPELLNDSGTPTPRSDIFALAMVMLEIFTGDRPFADQYAAVLDYVVLVYTQCIIPDRPELTPNIGLSDEIWRLMSRCWDRQPSKRPGLSHILSVVERENMLFKRQRSVMKSLGRDPNALYRSASRDSNPSPSASPSRRNIEEAALSLDDLQTALSLVDLQSRIHSHVFRRLQVQCALAERLPSEYSISEGLQRLSENPVAEGGFAFLYRGRYRGRDVAIKVLSRAINGHESNAVRKRFVQEGLIWKQLDHRNIVEFIGVSDTNRLGIHTYRDRPCLCLVSQWMHGGNMVDHLRENPEEDRLRLLVDVGMGLNYLHSLSIAHGDLKGVNVLIDQRGCAMLADFGLTRTAYDANLNIVSHVLSSSEMAGTWKWMAPEILWPTDHGCQRSAYTIQSDIYALGMVMYEVFSGRVPFEGLRDTAAILKVYKRERPSRPDDETAVALTDYLWAVVERCWHQDRERRPLVASVLSALQKAHEQQKIWSGYDAMRGRREVARTF